VSAFHSVGWPWGTPLVAECKALRFPWRHRHPAPQARCDCGIYAASSRLLAKHYRSVEPPGAPFPVLGSVSLWGTVVAAEEGWRASLAYPKELFLPTHREKRESAIPLAAALERYGVPVKIIDPPDELTDQLVDALRAA
jgi:hypothetical protein